MTAVEPTTDPASNKSRREVLCGLAVALLAPGALATACGDSNTSGGGSGATPTGGGGGGTTTGGGGAPTGNSLAAVSAVPEGSGLVVKNPAGGQLLLVRTGGEQVKAFNAACPHQGTTVNPPQGGTITCPNHGSQFEAATGALKRGPAKVGLKEVPVKVESGNVIMA